MTSAVEGAGLALAKSMPAATSASASFNSMSALSSVTTPWAINSVRNRSIGSRAIQLSISSLVR